MHISNDLPFGIGSLMAITYNIYHLLCFDVSPIFEKLFETIVLTIAGVFVSGITLYLCKKYLPKIFKK